MRVKKLQLKNGYKRFYNLTIDLGDKPKRIIALIGANGCGKSSVLDGMLFRNNAPHCLGNKGAKDYTYHSMRQSPGFNFHNIEIEFDVGNFWDVTAQRHPEGKENTIFVFRSPYRYNSNLKITDSEALKELRLNRYGASTTIDLDEKMSENYQRLKMLRSMTDSSIYPQIPQTIEF